MFNVKGGGEVFQPSVAAAVFSSLMMKRDDRAR